MIKILWNCIGMNFNSIPNWCLYNKSTIPNWCRYNKTTHNTTLCINNTLPTIHNTHYTHTLAIKLTKINLVWKQHLMSTIRVLNLELFLPGKETTPPWLISIEGTTQKKVNPEFLLWRKQDQFLVSWLHPSLTQSALAHMVGLTTIHEI